MLTVPSLPPFLLRPLIFGPQKQICLSCECCPVGRWGSGSQSSENGSDRSAMAVLTCHQMCTYRVYLAVWNCYVPVPDACHLRKIDSFLPWIYMTVSYACNSCQIGNGSQRFNFGFSAPLLLLPSFIHGLITCNIFSNTSWYSLYKRYSTVNFSALKNLLLTSVFNYIFLFFLSWINQPWALPICNQ